MKLQGLKLIQYNWNLVSRGADMSFIIKYSRFFSVHMKNDATGKLLQNFDFFPTDRCRRQFQNYNLVFRPRAYGFDVYYSEVPLVPISERTRFTFGFIISDVAFLKKYGLSKTDPSDPAHYQPGLYFDNLNPGGSIITGSTPQGLSEGAEANAGDTYRIYGQTFNRFDPNDSNVPSGYELNHKYQPGLTQTVPVSADPDAEYVSTTINSIDMGADYLAESGPYLLKANGPSPFERNVYLDNELSGNGARGVISIYWETSQQTVPDTGQQYQIIFKPT